MLFLLLLLSKKSEASEFSCFSFKLFFLSMICYTFNLVKIFSSCHCCFLFFFRYRRRRRHHHRHHHHRRGYCCCCCRFCTLYFPFTKCSKFLFLLILIESTSSPIFYTLSLNLSFALLFFYVTFFENQILLLLFFSCCFVLFVNLSFFDSDTCWCRPLRCCFRCLKFVQLCSRKLWWITVENN